VCKKPDGKYQVKQQETTSTKNHMKRNKRLMRSIGAAFICLICIQALALTLGRGKLTSLGALSFSSVTDQCTVTGGFTSPGKIAAVNIETKRIQYDIVNTAAQPMTSWTLNYPATVGPSIVGANLPTGYIDSSGKAVHVGGQSYTTIFNAGYGIYTYNPGAPWVIDYEKDHLTFSAAKDALPVGCGVGFLGSNSFMPTFAILFKPDLSFGDVKATATIGQNVAGTVIGPVERNFLMKLL
jgi:hypothetical protein